MEKHVLKVPKGGIFMVFIDIIEGRCPRAIHCVSILKGGLTFGFERFHYLDWGSLHKDPVKNTHTKFTSELTFCTGVSCTCMQVLVGGE